MKPILIAVTQVSLALLLALSLGLVTPLTSAAEEAEPRPASIFPHEAEYDRAHPHDVETTITWNDAKRVKSIHDGDNRLKDVDYQVTDNGGVTARLTIFRSYLDTRLTDLGMTVVLTITFALDGDDDNEHAVTFSIVSTDTRPTIDPEQVEYNLALEPPARVETTITLRGAKKVSSIEDGPGSSLLEEYDYLLTGRDGTRTLTILRAYLDRKLTRIGDQVELTIKFDDGNHVVFTIKAIGVKSAEIQPDRADFDLDKPDDIKTVITLNDATDIDHIIDERGNKLRSSVDYTILYPDPKRAELLIGKLYLAEILKRIDEPVALTIVFKDGKPATLSITPRGVRTTISPKDAQYNLDAPDAPDVRTTITWGTARTVNSIERIDPGSNDQSYPLELDEHYHLDQGVGNKATLTIKGSYLETILTDLAQTLELRVDFGFDHQTLTITTRGVQPRLSTTTGSYDRFIEECDLTTVIFWGSARSVSWVKDGTKPELRNGTDYTVGPTTDDGRATLTIKSDYLKNEDRLKSIGGTVTLTVQADKGAPVTFTITTSGTKPAIPINQLFVFDRNRPHDVEVTITLGSAKEVEEVWEKVNPTNPRDQRLSSIDGYRVDYHSEDNTATLTIDKDYLAGKLDGVTLRKLPLEIEFLNVTERCAFVVDTGCFIATAAYGTPMAEQIQVLREFRDRCLLTNPPGRLLAYAYYRVSPPLAGVITGHPTLKPVVRAGLMPAVILSAAVINTTFTQKLATAGMLVLISAALAVWTTRRRDRGAGYT
jgi:hypothetical protein